MAKNEVHRKLVKQLLDAKAVDFTALGKVLGEAGPELSLAEFGGDFYVGIDDNFMWFFRNPHTPPSNPNPGRIISKD
jgi:hypothetical protein